MNKNINMYKSVEAKSLSPKEMSIKVLRSLKAWLNDVTNHNLTYIQKINALNNSVALSVIILENMHYKIAGEERQILTNILNLIIKKGANSVTTLEELNKDVFKEDIEAIDLLIEIIEK